MDKKPAPPKPVVWNVYKIASKAEWLGAVEALDEARRDGEGRAGIGVAAKRLMAIRR
jgi:hypothetical protein